MPRRGWLALGAAVSLLFVIYGSLVPFDRNGVGLDVALASFRIIREAGMLSGSRVDFGSNVLLMMPAGFFLSGLTWSRTRPWCNVVTAVACLALCFAMSIGVEFLQLFFQSRSTAYRDIVAQALGALLGIGVWWLWGRRLWPRYFRAGEPVPEHRRRERIVFRARAPAATCRCPPCAPSRTGSALAVVRTPVYRREPNRRAKHARTT